MSSVLLVDDDRGIRTVLGRFVARHGYQVLHAADADEAAKVIRSVIPDLVITDLEMPGGGGFAVLEVGAAVRVPVVILTAHGTVDLAVQAMRKGAANFLTKPFTDESVAQVLQDAFGAR